MHYWSILQGNDTQKINNIRFNLKTLANYTAQSPSSSDVSRNLNDNQSNKWHIGLLGSGHELAVEVVGSTTEPSTQRGMKYRPHLYSRKPLLPPLFARGK